MFGYSPQVTDQSGQLMGAGMANAAQITSQGQISAAEMAMKQAQMEAQQRQAQQENIMAAVSQFAGAYAQNKALDAKAGAYKEFLGRHGAQLGLDPEWIKGFAKAPRDQQLAAGDLLTGNLGNRYFGYNYLVKQNEMYPRRGGGGAGASPAASGGSSFTF